MDQTTARIKVHSEEELAALIRSTAQAGRRARLRGFGSGGSKSGISHTPGQLVLLNPSLEPPKLDGDLVTVNSAIRLSELQDFLRPHNLMIPTVGEWQHPTVAGSLATGTHGGSAYHGIFSTSLESLRLISGTGESLLLDSSHPDFKYAAVSLGLLGITTTVTLRSVPRTQLQLTTDVVSFDEYRKAPRSQEGRTRFHASIWVPGAGKVIRFGADPVADSGRTITREQRFGWRTAIATTLSRKLGWHGLVSQRFFGRSAAGDAVDILSPIGVSPKVVQTRHVTNLIRGAKATEFALPADRAEEALNRLDELFRTHPASLNNPIGLRMSTGDEFTLSPCQGRDTLWVDLFYGSSPAFVAALAQVAGELEARCHWGKYLALSGEALKTRYAGWDDFRTACRRMDPHEVFANEISDSLGLTGVAS